MVTLLSVVAQQVFPSTLAARSVPDDSVHPEWPCCRQYDSPDAATTAQVVEDAPSALDLAADDSETEGEEHEWPCCRQYVSTPTLSNPQEIIEGKREPVVEVGWHLNESSHTLAALVSDPAMCMYCPCSCRPPASEISDHEIGDEPELPCCRQYDEPPAAVENVN